MSRFRMWRPEKDEEYTYMDETIREMFEVGGTDVYIHKYIGTADSPATGDKTKPGGAGNELKVQDLLFLENRDRNYDKTIYTLPVVYNLQDAEFDLRQFGSIMVNDTLFLEVHLRASVETIGRKFMPGDVLELPHLRDDLLLDEAAPAINKFYVITAVNRAAGGYSPLWWPHILRLEIEPITDSQEYQNLLQRKIEGDGLGGIGGWGSSGDGGPQTLQDILSDFQNQMKVNDALVEQARTEVDKRNFETRHLYVVPGGEDGSLYPWIFAGDGHPPNGAELASTGTAFPDPNSTDLNEGDWFLHVGYEPAVLYQYRNGAWKRNSVDYRKDWVQAHRILASYVNNRNVNDIQGERVTERQALSKVGKPRADF